MHSHGTGFVDQTFSRLALFQEDRSSLAVATGEQTGVFRQKIKGTRKIGTRRQVVNPVQTENPHRLASDWTGAAGIFFKTGTIDIPDGNDKNPSRS